MYINLLTVVKVRRLTVNPHTGLSRRRAGIWYDNGNIFYGYVTRTWNFKKDPKGFYLVHATVALLVLTNVGNLSLRTYWE